MQRSGTTKWEKPELPEHLQWVGLVDLNATFRTVVALLEVLHDAALTDCEGKVQHEFLHHEPQLSSFRTEETEAEEVAVHR